MSIDQHSPAHDKKPLTARWQAIRNAWRGANAASHHALGALVKLLVVVYFLFCALVLGLRYVVLPNIDAYKPDVERMASRALGNPVSIDRIDAAWRGLRPQLSLSNVVIHDRAGKPSLTLPQVSATLSWWSLVRADLRLHQLEISGPELNVQRDSDGKLYVAGIFIDTTASEDGTAADWVLSQREIVIRDGRLRWTDHQRAAPELLLENVDFVLHNRWHRHRLALKATPPSAFAAPLDIRARFDHPAFAESSNFSLWKGELYVGLPNTDLAAWRAYFDYPIDLQKGAGSVRAWLDFDKAKVADLTADLALSKVSARLGENLEVLNLANLSGRVSVREEFSPQATNGTPTFGRNGHTISLKNFSLSTEDGLVLPKTTISETFVPADKDRPAKTAFTAKLLDLETLANFAERLPLPVEQRRMLADFAPRGILRDFEVEWHGAYPDISAYRIKGKFEGLSLLAQAARPAQPKEGKTPARAAVPAIPGFENLSGRIDTSERGGVFNIVSNDLTLHLPGYVSEPDLPFEHFVMQASWAFQKQDQNQLLLDVQKMEFVHDGIAASFSGKHRMSLDRKPGTSPGVIDLSGKISRLDLKNTDAYLPLQTPDSLRKWLTGALVDGTLKDISLKLKGDLGDFPFDKKGGASRGEFKVSGQIENGLLNYAPGEFAKDGRPMWPLIEGINGSIVFNRGRMEIDAESARTSGTSLSQTKVVIPDLKSEDMVLAVDGKASGPLQNFVQFTKDSPVAEWIGHFTEETRAGGNAKLDLKLQLPLHHMEAAKVDGVLHFSGNAVTLQNALPPLAGTSGKLAFNEKGFSLNSFKSSFIGGPVTISGGTQPDGSIQVLAEGSISADGLRKAYSLPETQNSRQRLAGSTRYSTRIRVKDGQSRITVDSTLAGITLDFPEPLRKAATDPMPLRLELIGLSANNETTARDEIRLSLGSAVSARYEREKIVGKDADWRVVRGGIGVNVPAPRPDSGLIANVDMKSLDIDAWRRAIGSIVSQESEPQGEAQERAGPSLAQYLEPDVLAGRATELIVMGRKLDNVVVGASHQNDTWQANIDSRQASGYVTWLEPKYNRSLGRVTARLASLTIPKSAASEVTDLLEGDNETDRMPALDIAVDHFTLFDKKFGHLELEARNARGDSGWEWRIDKLRIANADGELKATGKWRREGEGRVSELAYTLDIADAGRLLDRFGFVDVLRGGKGRMEGDISWKGVPFSLDTPSLAGQLQLNISSGQFLKVDQGAQGAAKLLGVLSLQSLPRRLALDFRDVFSEGFAFDSVVAQANIARGVVRTDNFKMRSVSATVLIDGSADIARENQDLHVVVIPEINAGAASVVYGLAVNPVIGVGSFLAQLFLRDPLMKAFTFEYLITGPWTEPVVTKLKPAEARQISNQAEQTVEN